MTKHSEQFRHFALAVILSVGAGLIWAMVFGFGFGIANSIISSRNVHEQLLITPDGTPIIESYVGRNYGARTYRTLDGQPVEFSQNNIVYHSPLWGPVKQRKRFSDLSWSRRITTIRNDWYKPDIWYFVCDGKLDGRGYIVGYNRSAKAKIGYMGLDGFRTDEPAREEQFSVDGRVISKRGPVR